MTATIVCPHCGFESEDDELCRACGQPIESNPTRKVSLTYLLGNNLSSWMKNKGVRRVYHEDLFEDDLDFDPGWSILSTNIFHDDDE